MSAETPNNSDLFGIPKVDQAATPQWASVDAKKEDREWGDLDKIRAENDGLWLRCYGKILVVITIVFACIFLAALIIWTWHQLGPRCIFGYSFHWLQPEQLSKIQSLLFSGGMGAVISGIVRTQIDKSK